MKKLRISDLKKMKSEDLVKIVENWCNYDPKAVLIAHSELKTRNYKVSYTIEKKATEFSIKYNHSNIDEFISKYLSDSNYYEFYQKGIDGINSNPNSSGNNRKLTFSIIGAILGLPLSYYLQPEMLRQKLSLLDYITKINEVFEQKELIGNVIFSIVIFGVIGFAVGYFMDKNATKTTN